MNSKRSLARPAVGIGLLICSLGAGNLFANVLLVQCSESALSDALVEGGRVTFACDGTIVLTRTMMLTTNTVLDASDHAVTISGNHSVRVFHVAAGVDFTLIN